MPSLAQQFTGCRFVDRCNQALAQCRDTVPQWHTISGQHQVRCHLYGDNAAQAATSTHTVAQEAVHVTPSAHPVTDDTLLQVTDLKVYFPIRKGLFKRVVGHVKAVDGVSLKIAAGKTLALVGESGCGKTTIGKSILQLIQPTAGSVRFKEQELNGLKRCQLRPVRSQLQIIFQDPYASLNPRMRIIEILQEGINALKAYQTGYPGNDTAASVQSPENEIDALLQRVGLPAEVNGAFRTNFPADNGNASQLPVPWRSIPSC